MVFEVNEKLKLAIYWFSREDLEDKSLIESLMPEQKDWNQKGYRVCEFHSGTSNIVELTKELLIHNKETAVINIQHSRG